MNTEYPIADLCAALKVTRSGYHAWAGRQPGVRAQASAALLPLIHQAHRESRQTYGSPRILNWLQQRGQRCGRGRIARLMRAAGLNSRPRHRFRPVSLTDSDHDLPIAPNRLRDLATPQQRDTIWVADITYVETAEGWLYVAGVMDRWSRRVVGLAMAEHLRTELVSAALHQARTQRQPTHGCLHHSDRGCQYASAEYRRLLAAHGLEASMIRAGNCYDNAAMESFWSTLKNELIHRQTFATRAEARTAIFEYVEVFYNRQRLHSALGYKSPVDFENQNN